MQRKKVLYRNKFKPESKVISSSPADKPHLLSGILFRVSGVKRIKSGLELHRFFQKIRFTSPRNFYLCTITHECKAALTLYIRLHLL